MKASEAGGPGSGSPAALFPDAEAQHQEKQAEDEDGGHQRGVDEGREIAQCRFPVDECGVIFFPYFSQAGGERLSGRPGPIPKGKTASLRCRAFLMAARMPEISSPGQPPSAPAPIYEDTDES